MSVPGRERAGGEGRRHAGEAGMPGRRKQDPGAEGGGDHLNDGGAHPLTPRLCDVFCIHKVHVCLLHEKHE